MVDVQQQCRARVHPVHNILFNPGLSRCSDACREQQHAGSDSSYCVGAHFIASLVALHFAASISLTISSVTFGSRPSVCPLSSRITSATTCRSLHSGYTNTRALPGLGLRPCMRLRLAVPRRASHTYSAFVSTISGRRVCALQPSLCAQIE